MADFSNLQGYNVKDAYARERIDRLFEDKTIYIYGDSISSESASTSEFEMQPNWVYHFKNLLPSSATVVNESLSGRFITGNQGIADVMTKSETIDADIIIIFAGVNDFRHSRNIGISSDGDYTTLWGALNVIRNNILEKAPNAIVYIISPLKNYQTDYPETHEATKVASIYRTVLNEFAVKNGFNFIDGYLAPLLAPDKMVRREQFQPDGLHPNSTYAPLLCDFIFEKMKNGDCTTFYNSKVQTNISEYVSENITSTYSYCVVESDGKLHLHCLHTLTPTTGNNTVMTLPDWFRPMYTQQGAVRVSGSSGIRLLPYNISAANGNVVINFDVAESTVYELDVIFMPRYLIINSASI